MTISGGVLTLAAAVIALLGLSGFWAQRRYRRFDRLPVHFNASGKPTRFAPRRAAVWAAPVIFAVVLALVAALARALPPDQVRGDPDHAVILASLLVLGGQVFVLWMIDRWVTGQG